MTKADLTLDSVPYSIAIDPKSGRQSYQKREAPFSVQKISNGDPHYRDLTFWQRWAQVDWKNGAKQDIWNDPAKFWKSAGINPTVHEELTLERALASAGSTGSEIKTLAAWRVSQNWWNNNYSYRQKLTITNSSSAAYPTGLPVLISVDTSILQGAGKVRSDRNDWQVIYDNGSTLTQLKRDYIDTTHTYFALQNNIAAGQADSSYYIYYGYSSEATNQQPSSSADWDKVYGMFGTAPDANSIAIWHFREGSGGTVNDDILSHNQTTSGSPTWNTGGPFGRYLQYSSSSYSSTPNSSDLNLGSLTIEGWVNAASGQESYISHGQDSNDRNFGFHLSGGGHMALKMTDGMTDYTDTGAVVPAGSWHHVAVTYDGAGTCKFYLDGALNSTQTVSQGAPSASTHPVYINAYVNSGGSVGANGNVAWSHIRISNTVRSSFLYGVTSAPTASNGTELTTTPPASSFTLYAGCANGKIYSWDGVTTWTQAYDAGAPTVVFTGGGGSGATATATVVNGVITGVTVNNAGSGYTSDPTVTFTGLGGTGATATVTRSSNTIVSVTVTNGGTGYTTTVNCSLISQVGGTLKLYFGTGNLSDTTNGSARLISYDGSSWAINKVFNTVTESQILSLAEFNGSIYAGVGPQAKIYSTSDGSSWSISKQIRVPQNPGYIYALQEYNGRLYAAGGSPEFLYNKFYNGFLWAYDGSLWYNIYDFDFTTVTCMAVYDSNLFLGTYQGQLYVYNTASMDKLWDFREKYNYNMQIVSAIVYNDYLHFGLKPQGTATGNEAIYVFDRSGIHQAYQKAGVANYNCMVQGNNVLMIGTDTGYVYSVDNSNYITSGTLQTSYFDANLPSVDKIWDAIEMQFDPLLTGQSISVDYRYQDSDAWTNIGSVSTVGANFTTLSFPVGLYGKKIALRLTVTISDTTTTPRIINCILKYSVAQDIKKLWTVRVVCADNLQYPDRTYPYTQLTVGVTNGMTTLTVKDTSNFPSSGIIQALGGGDLITYTGKTSTTFTGCTGVVNSITNGSTIGITGRAKAQQLWTSRKNKKIVNLTDCDGQTYSVQLTEVSEDSFVIPTAEKSGLGIESEMSVSFVEL